MSVAAILFRWLTSRLIVGAQAAHRMAQAKDGALGRGALRARPLPLEWRMPWQTAQLISWIAGTLLAPTWWGTGVLLMIDAHSDHPVFWPSTMAAVAIANAVAIVCSNQRHHRRPFACRASLVLHYFKTSALAGGILFLLLGWGTGALQDFTGPMAASSAVTLSWGLIIAAAFCILSFVHAALLHAWLAFETPLPRWEPRGKV